MDIYALYKTLKVKQLRDFIATNQEENLHLEFKTITDPGFRFRDDRKNYAVALSGFANSDGGLIIWGIVARKNKKGIDCASGIKEIKDLPLFISKLNEFTGMFVSPIVDGVKHRKIETSKDKGFAITLIPPSDSGPHMAKAGEDRYYKRGGDSFYKMEHFDIEDMFGRRKKPRLSLYTDIKKRGKSAVPGGIKYGCEIFIGIKNDGRGTAKYPYLSLTVKEPYKISPYELHHWEAGLPILEQTPYGFRRYGGGVDIVIHPNSFLEVTTISFDIPEDAEKIPDLLITSTISAEDTREVKEETVIRGKDILDKILPRKTGG